MNTVKNILLSFLLLLPSIAQAEKETVQGINTFGVNLLKKIGTTGGNLFLSPFSIHNALSMTALGASNETQTQMETVLHASQASITAEYPGILQRCKDIETNSEALSQSLLDDGGSKDTVKLYSAQKLFAEKTFSFFDEFLRKEKAVFSSELERVNFKTDFEAVRKNINEWVEEQTRAKIPNLIPAGGLNGNTTLVLVNALYFKAPWDTEFSPRNTKNEPFHNADGSQVQTSMMRNQSLLVRYEKKDAAEIIGIPYAGKDVQLIVILPERNVAIDTLNTETITRYLEDAKTIPLKKVDLSLPKFKIEGTSLSLKEALMALGMPNAFDEPVQSADFSKMAVKKPDDYLAIGNVFHKAFIDIDEKGSEAAAATAVVVMRLGSVMIKPEAVPEVKIDRPFVFAIQDTKTGVAYFLGQVRNL